MMTLLMPAEVFCLIAIPTEYSALACGASYVAENGLWPQLPVKAVAWLKCQWLAIAKKA